MVVGFPSKKFPEYRFRFSGFRKDRGMALKDFGEKGWGLFDYQTLEIVMGERIEEQRAVVPPPPVPLTNDAFTVVLASVIDDPGLLATPLVQLGPKEVYVQASAPVRNPPPAQVASAPPTQATNVPPSKAASVPPTQAVIVPPTSRPNAAEPAPVQVAKDTALTAQVEKPSSVNIAPVVAPAPALPVKTPDPGIRKLSEQDRPTGRAILFVDLAAGGRPDTVDVFIDAVVTVYKKPAVDTAAVAKSETAPSVQQPVVEPIVPVQKDSLTRSVDTKPKAPVPAERTMTDSPDTSRAGAVIGPEKPVVQPDSPAAVPGKPVRSNCARMAAEKDLQALRRKMVNIPDEDDMVSAALKDAKLRCYTTAQVKALSVVFTRQEGKYKLIDAVYPYVYDPSNYGELEPLLTDKYFIHRFRALVQQ
jgi:hypothetical protein